MGDLGGWFLSYTFKGDQFSPQREISKKFIPRAMGELNPL